jgi:hypothetical protein
MSFNCHAYWALRNHTSLIKKKKKSKPLKATTIIEKSNKDRGGALIFGFSVLTNEHVN